MIKLYDIVSDEEFHPALKEVSVYKTEKDILLKENGLEKLIRILSLNELDNERVFLVTTDLFDRILGVFLVGLGDYKGSQMYNRHIAVSLLLSGARKFFLMHNHPDGALYLSEDDTTNFIVLTGLASILGIEVTSTYVITKDGFTSNKMDKPIYFKKGD